MTVSGVTKNMWTRRQSGLYSPARRNFPIDGLVFYAPLWHPQLNTSPFNSWDIVNGAVHACTCSGGGWSPLGNFSEGENDYITCGNGASLLITGANPRTALAWVRTSDLTIRDRTILSYGDIADASETIQLYLAQTTGNICLGCWNDDHNSTDPVTLDTWALVGFSIETANKSNIILDGEIVSTKTNHTGINTANGKGYNFTIARRADLHATASRPFRGTIGEVFVYNRALSVNEFRQVYRSTKWKYVKSYKTATSDAYYNSHGDMATLANGNAIMVYRKGTAHNGVTAKTKARISSDGGVTWGAEITVDETLVHPKDVDGVSVSVISDGTVFVTMWVQGGGISIIDGIYISRSTDNGATWEAPVQITACGFSAYSAGDAKVIELGDGSLRLPYYGRDADETYSSIACLKSVDGGDTWNTEVIIANGEADEVNYNHPGFVALGGNNILCVIRMLVGEVGNVAYGCWSTDGGANWSAPSEIFSCTGTPVRTIKLSDGRLVTFHRYSPDGDTHTIAAIQVSDDDGVTWSGLQGFDYQRLWNEGGGMAEVTVGGATRILVGYFTALSGNTAGTLGEARVVALNDELSNLYI